MLAEAYTAALHAEVPNPMGFAAWFLNCIEFEHDGNGLAEALYQWRRQSAKDPKPIPAEPGPEAVKMQRHRLFRRRHATKRRLSC